ncbi:MAG TPA: hypothetical protein VIF12_03390, partial [Micavibrio sp.]
ELYEAELKLANGKISGHCSCPADRDFGFCKHLVATALTVNDLKPGAENTKGRMELVRDYLLGLGKDDLAALVMRHAESDPAALKGLELAMKAAQGKSGDVLESMKKSITQATTTRGFVDYDRVPAWTRRLETALNQLISLSGSAPALTLDLLDYFFDRMEKALEEIDDSDGLAGDVCDKAAKIYRQTCRAAKLSPEDLAARLFQRETESSWNFFSGVCDDYRDIFGEKGLAEYRRLAEDAWEKLPSVNPSRMARDMHSTRRYALKSILDALAEGEDDLDARIALRAKDLSSSSQYLELAILCLENGREDDSLKWAEEGLWQFKDDKWPDERLKQFAFDLYMRRGDKTKMRDLIWNAFLQRPDMDKYAAIKSVSKDLAEQAIAHLKTLASETGAKRDAKGRPEFETFVLHHGTVGYMERRPTPAVLLTAILLSEKRLDEAWKIVETHDAPEDLLEELAKASEKKHADKSIAAYKTLIERSIGAGNTPAYKRAAKLIGRLAKLHNDDVQKAYVSSLKEKYKAKRNFIKLMK